MLICRDFRCFGKRVVQRETAMLAVFMQIPDA